MKKGLLIAMLALVAASFVFANGSGEESASGETKKIYFWHAFSDAPRSGWIQDRANEFNASQSEFEIVVEAKGSYRDTLQAAVLADKQGAAPHIVQVFEVGSQLAFDTGVFMPIGEIGSFDTSDYIEPVLNYYTLNGKVNSIPFNSSSPVLYINKDKLVEAGFDAEYDPMTYGEVIEVLEAAKAKGVEGAKFSMNLHGWFFEQWMAEQGADLVNMGNGRDGRATETLLTSDAAMNIANFMSELAAKDLYTYTGKLEDWGGSDAIFQEGQAMFHVTSTADIGNISSAVEGKFALGVGYLPIADGAERNGTVIGGASVWIAKNHDMDELTAARDFVLYMTNTENMVSWHKLTGYYPVRKSSIDALKAEGWFDSDANQIVAFNQLMETKTNKATAGAVAGTLTDNRTIVEEALQKIIQGADVASTLAEAKVLSDAKLAEYNANF
ncbi:MAG: extracellular solute-binding protein [Spirochaetales bacterium]|nr:extracellular solute-binding protein [Spirochaetales bacterium]